MNQETWKVYRVTQGSNQYFKAGIWEVSNHGNVRHNGIQIDLSKYDHQNYIGVGSFMVHRAVAELFIPNPENKQEVDHINTNKHDNRDVNLRWVTHDENMNNPLTRNLSSESHKGQIAWNKGIFGVSEETSEKMKEAWKYRKPDSEETRKKKSVSAKNRKPDSEETRKKKSRNSKGNKHSLNHKWMNNGIDVVYPHISECENYIKLGYKFGRL